MLCEHTSRQVCLCVGVWVRVFCTLCIIPPSSANRRLIRSSFTHSLFAQEELRKNQRPKMRTYVMKQQQLHTTTAASWLILLLCVCGSRFINVTVHSRIVFLSFRFESLFLHVQEVMFYLLFENVCVFFDRACAGKIVSQRIIKTKEMQQKAKKMEK